MSRSFKKKPYQAMCGGSAKWDKTTNHRGERRTLAKLLHCVTKEGTFEDFLCPTKRDFPHSNVYSWCRDGRQYYQGLSGRDISRHHRALFDEDYIWYGDEDYMSWPPMWYQKMMRK